MKKTNITLSPRSKMRLTPAEKAQLAEYVADDPAARKTIKDNTGVDSRTVNKTMKRGWLELSPGLKLRDFLKELKKLTA